MWKGRSGALLSPAVSASLSRLNSLTPSLALLPDRPYYNSGPRNPSIAVFELRKNSRTVDFGALILEKGQAVGYLPDNSEKILFSFLVFSWKIWSSLCRMNCVYFATAYDFGEPA